MRWLTLGKTEEVGVVTVNLKAIIRSDRRPAGPFPSGVPAGKRVSCHSISHDQKTLYRQDPLLP